MRKPLVFVAIAASLLAGPAFGQDPDDSESSSSSAQTKRKDPKGVRGISPYREQLANGRTAFANGDHSGSIDAFDAAIAEDSARMSAYFLKAQAQLAKGDLEGARSTAEKARSKRGNKATNAKLLFFVADLEEQSAGPSKPDAGSDLKVALQSVWEKVKESWTSYAAYLTSHTDLPNYEATATERKKQVDARIEREQQYGAVAERIRKNQAKRDSDKK